jgi:cysteine-rich repeat protein/predicted outer membrane repeat protein
MKYARNRVSWRGFVASACLGVGAALLAVEAALLAVGASGCLVDFGARSGGGDAGTDDDAGVEPRCGDQVLDPGEACDGSELGDRSCGSETGIAGGELRCTDACEVDLSGCEACGNAEVDGAEDCDDGNSEPGDGCDGCRVEPGWMCGSSPSICDTVCGDGLVIGDEGCDDRNTGGGDGCDADCQVEDGWSCSGEPSVCGPACGDGNVGAGEQCDDGNTEPDDGCDPHCVEEVGWDCDPDPGPGPDPDPDPDPDAPSVCVPVCGDGLLRGSEGCDDGGTDSGDGCSASCEVEPFSACDGEPSQCGCVVYVSLFGPQTGRTGERWGLALESPREASAAAAQRAPCEVWVAAGTYYIYDSGDFNTVTLPSEVGWYGGFVGNETARSARDPASNPTVLSGRKASGDPARVLQVMTADSVQNVVVDGFTIEDGYNPSDKGAGIDTRNATLQVVGCTLQNNQAKSGGAICVNNTTLEVDDCVLRNNLTDLDGGAIQHVSGDLTVRNSRFESNEALDDGGALDLRTGTVTVSRSWFVGNQAADYGGALRLEEVQATFSNVVVSYSSGANLGGGMFCSQDAAVQMSHVTFWENSAIDGASIFVASGHVDIYNSIVWTADSDHLEIGTTGDIDINYCVVSGGYGGTGVSHDDPLLVSPLGGDYRPSLVSPAVDSADGSYASATDILGNPRVDIVTQSNTGVGTPDFADRGAVERQP